MPQTDGQTTEGQWRNFDFMSSGDTADLMTK